MSTKKLKWDYCFEWVDELLSGTLNPDKNDLNSITANELNGLKVQFSKELTSSYRKYKAGIFMVLSDKKIRTLGNRYLETLQYLLSRAYANLASYDSREHLTEAGEYFIMELDELKREFELRFQKYVEPTTASNDASAAAKIKLTCRLSVDQIGILLKAADETRLILSRSLSYIYRALVPFLQTEKISNISWDSMRKGTYKIEQSDKEQVIQILQNLIRKINEY